MLCIIRCLLQTVKFRQKRRVGVCVLDFEKHSGRRKAEIAGAKRIGVPRAAALGGVLRGNAPEPSET